MILHGIHVERKDLPLWKIQLLLLEILPKLLIGDFWIFRSYLDYRKQIKNIEDSRKSLQILMDKHERKISILDLEEYFEKSLFLQNPTFL